MLGFITGLAAEARLLRGLPVEVGVGGGTPAGATLAAERVIRQNVDGLVSFGLAGGLAPELRPGAIIIPHAVIAAGIRHSCDSALLVRLGGATHLAILAGSRIAANASQKAALHKTTRAAAIDLESGAVAAAAISHGLPFAALRAIADPATRDLPEAALLALDHKGRIALPAIIRSLLGNPAQLVQLAALAGDAAAARQALAARLVAIGKIWSGGFAP